MDKFDRDGYIIIPDFFDAELAGFFRDTILDIAEKERQNNTSFLYGYGNLAQRIYNLINKTDEFTVNIALINNKKAVFGIVAAPVSGRTWIGSVFDNNSYDEENFNKNIRIVMSKSHKSENDKAFLQFLNNKEYTFEVVEKGSSLKLCTLADNDADIYPRFGPTSEWDIAAAHAVLSSHGGSVIKINDNEELDYAKESSILNPYFIAFRNNALKNEFLPVLGDFFKKLV